jgi:hypothetical protein
LKADAELHLRDDVGFFRDGEHRAEREHGTAVGEGECSLRDANDLMLLLFCLVVFAVRCQL